MPAAGTEKRPGVSGVFPGRISPGGGGKAPFSGLTVRIWRQMRADSSGCITMQMLKITPARSWQFSGWFVAIFTSELP
ncbi:TPA_asm: hypothetical protein G1Q02_25455 [Salmonella enterica subsp. enterica serovar Typhimurium]|nr:hypothetical protein [Salmonella enterica subsp. enterica serovar Typhimurium]